MAAYDTGKIILFIRSVLWDLNVPQIAATVLFEDIDGCTAMGNAQKPTSRTRHMDIKYFSLCCRLPRYVPYRGTFVPYDGTYGVPD